MSSSGQRTKFRLVSVDDLDPDAGDTLADDLIGRKIAGRYTIQAHLGGGGMADIYRASDDELGIDVAIKLLKPGIATSDMRARMVQEAQAAARVRHGNLVRVFGTGKLDDTAYIAMELLEGPNLETYLRERPGQRLAWKAALDLLLPALDALHAVHEQGYVHRDIKPGNILVAREPDGSPRAIVIDLGLAKPDRALRPVAGPPTTEVGRVLCTPGYASPEQALEHPVDRRSDVYSMAITLYRVLAGRLPFHEARGKPMHVVLAHHVHHEPTSLIDAARDADIPPAIAAVIESALAKDPTDRPQTMLKFADALEAAGRASLPPARSAFHYWPHAIVLAQLLIVLFTWSIIPAARDQSGGRLLANLDRAIETKPTVDAPNPTPPSNPPPVNSTPPEPQLPAPSPPPPAETNPPQPTRPSDPTDSVRRELARRARAVQVCSDADLGSVERIAVSVNIDTTGRVSAHVQDAADTTLSRCLAQVLQHRTPTPPSRPMSFVHVYKLRANNPRRP